MPDFAPPATPIPVAVLGATGSVGQRFVQLLDAHPWFHLAAVTGSQRSAGRPYGEATRWILDTPMPAAAAALTVRETATGLPARLLFSALGGDVAAEVERDLAAAGHLVVSNASAHRMDADVPLLVPEVNPDHLELAATQPFAGGGALLTNPNCSTIGLASALAPIHRAFGVDAVLVTTLQAVSGAGLPGVASLAILDNVIPFIGGEEEKLESELRKIFGRLEGDGAGDLRVEPASITVSAQCTRVPVSDGHTECVSFRLRREATAADLRRVLAAHSGEPQRLGLPSAPRPALVVLDADDRPQPRLDRGRGGGMTTTVGRLRPCPVLGWKLVLLSHNTVRGAAGGSLLVAELAVARGLLPTQGGA